MPLDKINVFQEADKLTEPLAVATLTRVEDFAVLVYICQGAVAWHSHDQDELFFVQEGEITLETELGQVVLREEEMAVVPRQTAHSSSSSLWSVVMLFTRAPLVAGRNGHRKMYLTGEEPPLAKVSLVEETAWLTRSFSPLDLAPVNNFVLRLALAQGEGPWHRHPAQEELLLAHEGELLLESEMGDVVLYPGEMAVLPRGVRHRFFSAGRATFLTFASQALDVKDESKP
jgi:quercetin dioxygenase-like cupin family protein